MNRDSFFKFQNESRIDNSRKFENRAYPNCELDQSPSLAQNQNKPKTKPTNVSR